ncbi:MAG: nuclease-related domain-containing protein [Chloroflexota bacterium]
MKTRQEKRSPLRDRPLRYAGQSLDESIEDKALSILQWLLMTVFTGIIVVGDWIRYLYPGPAVKPWFITIVFVAIVVWAIIRMTRAIKEIGKLRMARDGEKLVGEGLQELIKQGATVFHDIQGEKFNIDHVVVSQHGIFLVETKTYSKPLKKEAVITHDESNIYVDGFPVERNPIDQVNALSNWLGELLQKSTGNKFYIKPVILFPGWYTEKVKGGEEIWILNPKALPIFIANEPIRLKETDTHLVAFHLSRYIRTYKTK